MECGGTVGRVGQRSWVRSQVLGLLILPVVLAAARGGTSTTTSSTQKTAPSTASL